jgi:hypothetical protein
MAEKMTTYWIRFRLAVTFIFLVMSCGLNKLLGGSFNHTLSGTAWRNRERKYWNWLRRFINGMFFWQPNHCHHAAMMEEIYGSVWHSLGLDWRFA